MHQYKISRGGYLATTIINIDLSQTLGKTKPYLLFCVLWMWLGKSAKVLFSVTSEGIPVCKKLQLQNKF